MATLTLPAADPISSGEIQTLDTERFEEVERRHELLAQFLKHSHFDGLLVTAPENVAWLTCGSRLELMGAGRPGGALFVTADSRLLLCPNSESGQFFDREVAGLGFHLKERPWEESRDVLLSDLCRGRRVAADHARDDCVSNVTDDLRAIRTPLGFIEARSLKKHGFDLADAVEATCRKFERGQSEQEVAGHLAHRMMRHGIESVRIQVLADSQSHRYRNWTFGPDPIHRSLTLAAVGRRDGLHAACSRTVSFGPPPTTIRNAHEVASLVQATGLYFSQPGWSANEVWKRIARIYEKFGAPEEWRQAEQAELVGYGSSETRFTPTARFTLAEGEAVHWHPSVRTAYVSDTILIRQDGVDVTTVTDKWPMLTVSVKGTEIERPAILVRDDTSGWAID